MPLILALVLLILAEISLYVTLGAALGLGLTLAVVVGSAVAGILVVRAQGRHMVERMVETAMDRRNPLRTAGDGMLKVIAGILLILPGFLTDLAGLVLLLPPVRAAILARLADRARSQAADLAMRAMLHPRPAPEPPEGPVVDSWAEEVTPPAAAPQDAGPHRPSGWTRSPKTPGTDAD